ncbi:hypothetical protein NLJ89_g5212 [Agrocybe chaxingu]|uniref:Uncharacterized protein n=1 Tax=Agrocybe chaxingu TaxID=84603 RepID=A0A9W8K8L4_9AGAR|nr:hypothetical protein NLJ89_g5212 [Agrocybe chaxingu]
METALISCTLTIMGAVDFEIQPHQDAKFKTPLKRALSSPFPSPERPLQKRKLRPSQPHVASRISCFFTSGGALDSQTTDSQWLNGVVGLDEAAEEHTSGTEDEYVDYGSPCISQHHLIELELGLLHQMSPLTKAKEEEGDEHLLQLNLPVNTAASPGKVMSCGQDANPLSFDNVSLKDLKMLVLSLTSQCRLLEDKLLKEREWVGRLETSLQENRIVFPQYPL